MGFVFRRGSGMLIGCVICFVFCGFKVVDVSSFPSGEGPGNIGRTIEIFRVVNIHHWSDE